MNSGVLVKCPGVLLGTLADSGDDNQLTLPMAAA